MEVSSEYLFLIFCIFSILFQTLFSYFGIIEKVTQNYYSSSTSCSGSSTISSFSTKTCSYTSASGNYGATSNKLLCSKATSFKKVLPTKKTFYETSFYDGSNECSNTPTFYTATLNNVCNPASGIKYKNPKSKYYSNGDCSTLESSNTAATGCIASSTNGYKFQWLST
jgi:hypothetical protein